MKMNVYSKGVGLSLITAVLLGSSAYAGLIKGVAADADYVPTEPPTQHGFGGWNLDNVNVKITDLNFVEIAKTFDKLDGMYDPMVIGDSFESEILDAEGTIVGKLHGKNWPVGEPAGIKVVHDDNTTQSGKYPNCIMTTSYLDAEDSGTGESGYLDADNPVPTKCSSPFQTHKRFKLNMLPNTVAVLDENRYGKPIDLVFNLDGDDNGTTEPRGYQVFQKINNYTGMRLDGYKVEVIGEFASAPIKFVLDLTPTKDSDDDEESSAEATFSNGLWGPKDTNQKHVPLHFEEDGFFDNVRAGFEQVPSDETNTTLIGGPDTLAGNYEALFGLWLPSKWAPYGIFHDDDEDPLTDAKLEAFWGTTPGALAGTAPTWHKGQDYNTTDADGDQSWAEPTEALAELADNNPLYSIGIIEDTLNLGLNYAVEVGQNSLIGSKFTIRITPHVAADQTAPSYIDAEGNPILPPQVIDPEEPVTPTDSTTTYTSSSSDGGSCTFNPNITARV